MKKKILLVANYYEERGGISASVENLYKILKTKKYNISLFSLGHKIKIYRIPKYLKLIFTIPKFNIIHCHGSSYLGFIPVFFSAVIAFIFKKKIIITYHGATDKYLFVKNSLLLKIIKKNIIAVITPSRTTVEFFKDFEFKSFYIPNIIDKNRWIFEKRKKINPKIVCTRSNYNTKELLEIFLLLKKRYKNLEFNLFGGITNINLLKKIKKTKSIVYRGQIRRNELSKELAKSDIYLNLLSIDSFGYSIFEAMACGLSIVSVKSKSFNDYKDIINFPKRDNILSIVDTIKDIIENQERSIEKTNKSLKIIQNFSSEKIYCLWDKLYSNLKI